MNPTELLLQIQALLADRQANWKTITRLLREHDQWAEVEVARLLVMQALGGEACGELRSADPRARLAALDVVVSVFPRSAASAALRRLAKDPDRRVRRRAEQAVYELFLGDVALPDARFAKARTPWPLTPGQWDATGWRYGLPDPELGEPRKKAAPALVAQARRALPPLADPGQVAALLGYQTAGELRALMRPGKGPGSSYVEFTVPKARGGERTLAAPRPALKKAQRVLLKSLLDGLPVHEASHGFVRGRSVLTNATPHAGSPIIVKADLRDFFPSVHYRRVAGLFATYGYAKQVAGVLAGLTTRRSTLPDGTLAWPGALPQGAPTSPAIANLVCRRLDARLAGLARSVGGRYTRYADDLTFSLPAEPTRGLGRFFWWIDQICQQEGFCENTAKRRVLRGHQQQRVTGVVVNEKPAVPRALRRLLRAILFNCQKHGVATQARGREGFEAWLRGMIAHVHAIQPELGARWLREVDALLKPGR